MLMPMPGGTWTGWPSTKTSRWAWMWYFRCSITSNTTPALRASASGSSGAGHRTTARQKLGDTDGEEPSRSSADSLPPSSPQDPRASASVPATTTLRMDAARPMPSQGSAGATLAVWSALSEGCASGLGVRHAGDFTDAATCACSGHRRQPHRDRAQLELAAQRHAGQRDRGLGRLRARVTSGRLPLSGSDSSSSSRTWCDVTSTTSRSRTSPTLRCTPCSRRSETR